MTTVIDQPDKATAVALLARGLSTEAVGREIGVDGRRVRRWREAPEFQAEVEAARRAILAEAVSALTAAVRDAVSTLHESLEDSSAAVRVRAASEILRALPLLADHAELETRLTALEARLNEQEQPSWQAA
ncbi:hypothetical protein ACGFYP_07480 [Streptomyces sp. NPDC048370]|uniref:hypothetical protein n=1 Tax=Streptomyces sp. NPDC048370 TaxID=3365540 RepID=UPI00371AD130